MTKRNDDPRPDQAKAPAEHADREGATDHSGFQPSEKFADQGSEPYTQDGALNSSARTGLQKK